MRVTTIIKDYITNEVNKKYKEKLDSIPNDYQNDWDKMVEELEEYTKQCNIKAKEIVKKYDMLPNEEKDYTIIDYHTYRLGNDERRNIRKNIEYELGQKKKDTIARIILDLELGETNKKELTEILSKIEF